MAKIAKESQHRDKQSQKGDFHDDWRWNDKI